MSFFQNLKHVIPSFSSIDVSIDKCDVIWVDFHFIYYLHLHSQCSVHSFYSLSVFSIWTILWLEHSFLSLWLHFSLLVSVLHLPKSFPSQCIPLESWINLSAQSRGECAYYWYGTEILKHKKKGWASHPVVKHLTHARLWAPPPVPKTVY